MITFDDLVSRQFLSKFTVDLPGVGKVEMKQLCADEAASIVRESQKLEGDELESFISLQAASFIKGCPVLDDELAKFRSNLTAKTISLIYTKGLESALSVPGDLEQAEKNLPASQN